MYRYSPFMVTSSADGESRPIYEGLYMIEGYDEEFFFLRGWPHIYGLALHLSLRRFTIAHD
jgi:hypothetical protein